MGLVDSPVIVGKQEATYTLLLYIMSYSWLLSCTDPGFTILDTVKLKLDDVEDVSIVYALMVIVFCYVQDIEGLEVLEQVTDPDTKVPVDCEFCHEEGNNRMA